MNPQDRLTVYAAGVFLLVFGGHSLVIAFLNFFTGSNYRDIFNTFINIVSSKLTHEKQSGDNDSVALKKFMIFFYILLGLVSVFASLVLFAEASKR